MLGAFVLLVLGLQDSHATCRSLEPSRFGLHQPSGRPFLPYGESTFYDSSNNIWLTFNLVRSPDGRSGPYDRLDVAISYPTALNGITHLVRHERNLFSLHHDLTFQGTNLATGDVEVRISYDQRLFMVEPGLRLRGIPLGSVSTIVGKTRYDHVVLIPVQIPAIEKPLFLDGIEANVVLQALEKAGYLEHDWTSLGISVLAVTVPEIWAFNGIEVETRISVGQINLTQAALLEGAMDYSLRQGAISHDHPIFSHPAIQRVREVLNRRANEIRSPT